MGSPGLVTGTQTKLTNVKKGSIDSTIYVPRNGDMNMVYNSVSVDPNWQNS